MIANLILSDSSNLTDRTVLLRSLLYLVLGISNSHMMRFAVRSKRLMDGDFKSFIVGIVSITFLFVLMHASVEFSVIQLSRLRVRSDSTLEPPALFLRLAYTATFLYFGWTAIYTVIILLRKSRTWQFDNLHRIERLRELELKSIKSSITPHFIFNALNSIRALIEEDTVRARIAVTSLGNVLHKSLQTEHRETVSLGEELSVVSDYLDLQKIRFEERMGFTYEIDSGAMDLQVPVMMLLTMVENAVKHGVDRNIRGGSLHVSASGGERVLELCVRNSGRLERDPKRKGFGLQSVSERLVILYGESARFDISEESGSVVARLSIPQRHGAIRQHSSRREAMRSGSGV